METAPKKAEEPRLSYRFDTILEDEKAQDALNRRMRKPGEPGYCLPAKKSVMPQRTADHGPADERAASKEA